MRLENWSVVASQLKPYQAPELAKPRFRGFVYGHPRFDDGTEVMTSPIMDYRDGKFYTLSGSDYELGMIDLEYEEMFPRAFERIKESAEKIYNEEQE